MMGLRLQSGLARTLDGGCFVFGFDGRGCIHCQMQKNEVQTCLMDGMMK